MNDEIRDALPDLLHGRLSELDTATLSAHIESCADCRRELELLREVRQGNSIVPRLDVASIAAAIPPYAGTDLKIVGRANPVRSAFAPVWKFVAAAMIVVVGVVGITQRSATSSAIRSSTRAPAAPVALAPAVVNASPDAPTIAQTTQQLSTAEKQVASLSLVGNLQDLSDSDIEQLLSDLDGIETLPSAEPQSVTTALDDAGTDQ